MCGIAGVVSTKLSQATVASAAQAMQAKIKHRGPDDHGAFLSPSHAAALAHTRLSIIDLSTAGHQPMSVEQGRYTISYNGEIYNYQALRSELQALGERFDSNSDTEVILRLYKRHGYNCVPKLRGMFAFFIWDEHLKQGFAARDAFGIKPLYYWHDQHTLGFASELRSLLASNLFAKRVSAEGLNSYFKRGAVSEPNTLIGGVQLLPAGHWLSWQDGNIELLQHAKLSYTASQISQRAAVTLTRTALQDSVAAHLVSDVPVGIFLSGGIDSTALLALASQISDKQINTYSIAFEDPLWNEGELAKRVAQHFNSKHTELVMTRTLAQSLFKQYLQCIDQPSIDGFNTWCVSKLAYDHGQKVVLSGLGADELFAGYKSFEILPKMVRISKLTGWAAPLLRPLARLRSRLVTPRLRRILDFLSQPGSLTAAHQSLRGIFANAEADALVGSYAIKPPEQPAAQTDPLAAGKVKPSSNNIADQISQIELFTYMRNQLLRDSDVMSMAWGLELRVPFVDFELAQKIASIPAEIRLAQGKKLLIESVPELPEWVVNRPKQGFRFPFDEWFSDDWERLDESSSSQSSAQPKNNTGVDCERKTPEKTPSWIVMTPWYRRWSVVVLSYWLKRYC